MIMTDLSLNILFKKLAKERNSRFSFYTIRKRKNFKNYYLTVLDKVNSLKLLT